MSADAAPAGAATPGPIPGAGGAAPAAPQPSGAPQGAPPAPLDPNEKVMLAFGVGQENAPAPQPSGAQADPLAEVLASLPADHPAHARMQALRTAEGRLRAQGQESSPQLEAMQRNAEVAAIAAVRAGADPHTLAASLGVDPQALIEAAGGLPAPAAPGSARAEGAPVDPPPAGAPQQFDFIRSFYDFQAAANPAHQQSWSRPVFEAQDSAAQLREQADQALAAGFASDDPAMRERSQRQAEQLRGQARQQEAMAYQKLSEAMHQIPYQMFKALNERLKHFEDMDAEDVESREAEAASNLEWRTLSQSLRAKRGADGLPEYGNGPGGAGIYQLDENGNCGAPTPKGKILLTRVHEIISERGWSRSAASFEDACAIYAHELSDDGNQPAQAGQDGGGGASVSFPPSLTPGNGGVRPSQSGRPVSQGGQVAMY